MKVVDKVQEGILGFYVAKSDNEPQTNEIIHKKFNFEFINKILKDFLCQVFNISFNDLEKPEIFDKIKKIPLF